MVAAMARVVVVGGGYGGLAAAARLAKLGHEVTLLERAERLGGALAPVESEGFVWDGGPHATLLPAVLRDLFRKSGRPLERELDLVPLPVVREHRFADGSSVSLPGGSRAAQIAAVDALGIGLGRRWADHVASYDEDWEVLRREYLERPWDRHDPPSALLARLRSRETLDRRARLLGDERLRLLATHPATWEGHDARRVPAWAGLTVYLEQRFGAWTIEGGMATLARALASRLATRRVTVHLGTQVTDLVVRSGRVAAVATREGQHDADVVVVAIDPRRLGALASSVRRTRPAETPRLVHLGLAVPAPIEAAEMVLHDASGAAVVVRPGGLAPAGHVTWTVSSRDPAGDPLALLAQRGLDVRDRVVVRVDRSPREVAEACGGSPFGVEWRGRRTTFDRLGPETPITGVYAAGAHATPGSGLPFVGLSAALVAQLVGPA